MASTASIAFGASKTSGKVLAGRVEKVGIEGHIVKAKLDTGAKTSSIDAFDIKPYKKGKQRRVSFTMRLHLGKNVMREIKMDLARSRRVKIKSHNGNHDRRIAVELPMCFDGRKHMTEFTLSDRKEYIYGVLLGRAFLNGVAIIDPSLTFQTLRSSVCQ